MIWIHSINESAAPELVEGVMNPMHPDKFRTLGTRIRLKEGQRVLDIGAGRCGPALILAERYGCYVTAVEPYEPFLTEARQRVEEAGLAERFEFIQTAGADFEIEPDRYDAALCVGADWAFGGVEGTVRALTPGVVPGGHIVVATVYKAEDKTSTDGDTDLKLEEFIGAFERNGLRVVTLLRSTIEEMDTYHSVQATSLLDWIDVHPDDPEVGEVEQWRREQVAELSTVPFGWAIVAGRKPYLGFD